MYSERKKIKGN